MTLKEKLEKIKDYDNPSDTKVVARNPGDPQY